MKRHLSALALVPLLAAACGGGGGNPNQTTSLKPSGTSTSALQDCIAAIIPPVKESLKIYPGLAGTAGNSAGVKFDRSEIGKLSTVDDLAFVLAVGSYKVNAQKLTLQQTVQEACRSELLTNPS
jgi:hypothetical protein